MKVVALKDADLRQCLSDAKREDVVITQRAKPVAMLVGVEGLDLEQTSLAVRTSSGNSSASGAVRRHSAARS